MTGPSDDVLRETYRTSLERSDRDGCPDPEALAGLAVGRLDPAAHERVLAHLEVCTACADELRHVLPERPERAAPASRSAFTTRGRSAGLVAAAAVLVAVAGIALWQLSPRGAAPRLRAADAGLPHTAIEDGAALPREAFVLRWTTLEGAEAYDVVVTRADLSTVWRATIERGSECVVPASALAPLAPGATVMWRVEARLSAGQRRASPLYRQIVR